MTKTEFFDFIESSIDFLEAKEKEVVLTFFEKKFSLCSTDDDEKMTIEAFGELEEFIEKFRTDYRSFKKTKKGKDKAINNYLESRFRHIAPKKADENDNNISEDSNCEENKISEENKKDKKGSKKNKKGSEPVACDAVEEITATEDKATDTDKNSSKKKSKKKNKKNDSSAEEKAEDTAKSEPSENKETNSDEIKNEEKKEKTPLPVKEIAISFLTKTKTFFINFAKSTMLLVRKISSKLSKNNVSDETVLEPIDEANGLTAEEIDLAKAETLEKANSFYEKEDEILNAVNEEKVFSSDDDGSSEEDDKANSAKPIPLEEEVKNGKKIKLPKIPEVVYPGLFNQFIPKDKYDKKARLGLLALMTLAVSPALLAAFTAVLFVYAALVAFTLSVSLCLFAVMVVFIAIGIVELVHGLLLLFDCVPAALIEIGFGTMLFSIVVAIGAMVYEFMFGVVPKWLKWITAIFIRYTKLLFCYLYGGKA